MRKSTSRQMTYHSIDMLRAEIRNYRKYVKYKADLLDRLEELWYDLTGVKAIRYDKMPTSFNKSISEEKRLSLLDRIDYYESEVTRVDMQIRYIDSILDRLTKEENELITYVLIEGHTEQEAGDKWYLTNSAISKWITRILDRVQHSNIEQKKEIK